MSFKVIITKLEDFYEGNDSSRKSLKDGASRTGYTDSIPEIGKSFIVIGEGKIYKTSLVQEVVSEDIFKTFNSTYRWKKIE